jgi:hypothetical protein
VEHERISVSTKLGNNEGDALRHEPGNKCNVAREAVESGHQNRALDVSGGCKRGGRPRAPVERVSPLPAFAFDVVTDHRDTVMGPIVVAKRNVPIGCPVPEPADVVADELARILVMADEAVIPTDRLVQPDRVQVIAAESAAAVSTVCALQGGHFCAPIQGQSSGSVSVETLPIFGAD